jgi:hypothetical protein
LIPSALTVVEKIPNTIKKVLNRKIITILARSTSPNKAVQIRLKIEATATQIKPEKNG